MHNKGLTPLNDEGMINLSPNLEQYFQPVRIEIELSRNGITLATNVDTKIVRHYFSGMVRNVTIVLEERVADWARVEAAKRRTSLSRMVGEMLAEKMRQEETYEDAMRQFLGLNPERLRRSHNEKLPSRNETYEDARGLRG
jgi:hypothetical protein